MGKNNIFRVQEAGAASLAVLQEACNNICCQPKRVAAALPSCPGTAVSFLCNLSVSLFYNHFLLLAFAVVTQEFIRSFGLQPAQLHSAYLRNLEGRLWKNARNMACTPSSGWGLSHKKQKKFLFFWLCFGLCLSFDLTFSCLFLLNFHFLHVIRSGSHTSHSVET